MKIQFKRNANISSALPASANAGEPIWFQDKLYIGSVGATAGGTTGAAVGDLIPVVPASLPPSAHSHVVADITDFPSNWAWANITGQPTTISGYGITDAKIESGTITLGSSTITPLTSWDNSSNYAFKTIAPANATTTVTGLDGNTTSLVADSSTDTLNVKGYNKWIVVGGANSSNTDTLNIAHLVRTEGTNTTSTGTVSSSSNTFDVVTYTFDEAGHETKKDTKTITVNFPSGSGSGGSIQLANVTGSTATKRVTYNQASLSGHTLSTSGTATNTDLYITKTPSASDPLVTWTDIGSLSGAMHYKGTINGTTGLPTTGPVTAGDTYYVGAAGTYAGQACEVGDMVIAKNAVASGTNVANTDWTVVQTNINGAVTGPASSTSGNIATFDGTTGKVIQDSGYTIETSVPSGAVFTDKKVTPVALSNTGTTDYNILLANNSSTPTTNGQPNYATGAKINGRGEITASKITIKSSSTDMLLANGNTLAQSTFAAAGHDHSGVYQPVGNYKTTQTAVSDPTASGNSTSFISSISQDTNGVITASKANLPTASTTVAGITTVGASGGAAAYDHSHSGYLTTFNDSNNYAFKTVAVAAQSTAVSNTAGTTSAASLTAGSNTDTLNINSANKWICTNTATSKTLKLGHLVGTIATNAGSLQKFNYDEAGHITAVKAVVWSDITELSGYTDNNDTYTFSTTATNGKFSDTASGSSHTITLTEIDGGTF